MMIRDSAKNESIVKYVVSHFPFILRNLRRTAIVLLRHRTTIQPQRIVVALVKFTGGELPFLLYSFKDCFFLIRPPEPY